MSYDTDTGGLFNAIGIAQIEATHGADPIHERTRIREFFAAQLAAVLDDPSRLHSDPTLAVQGRASQFELPAMNISTSSESSEPYYTGPESTKHDLELVVLVIGAEPDPQDADEEVAFGRIARLLDSIALGVETVLLDEDGRPASIIDVLLVSSEPSFNSDGLRRMGECRLTFTVTYTT